MIFAMDSPFTIGAGSVDGGAMKGGRAKAASIACGVACALAVFAYTASVQGEAERARAEALARYGGDQVEVCVAARDIAPGETVDASAVEVRLWLADLLPPDAVTSIDQVVGAAPTSSILEGEVVSMRRFGEEASLIDVPDGLVAVSVPAQDVRAVGGAIAPGSHVDVYATGTTSTSLIGEGMLVLATSASASADAMGASVTWATLAVAPGAVQELVSAAQNMELYFALPSDGESEGERSREEA